jgi:hypothetical protein
MLRSVQSLLEAIPQSRVADRYYRLEGLRGVAIEGEQCISELNTIGDAGLIRELSNNPDFDRDFDQPVLEGVGVPGLFRTSSLERD